MAKGFVNYAQRDDMQEDTYQIIAALVIEGVGYRREKDPMRLFTITDTLYDFVALEISKNEADPEHPFKDRLAALENKVFSNGYNRLSPQLRSELYVEVRSLWRECLAALRKAGLLFKMKADLDNIL